MYKQIFYTNVLRVLQQQGLSKQSLARDSGVSGSFLSDLTNGKGNPSLEVMVKIADALGVPLDWLLTTHDLGESVDKSLARPMRQPDGLPEGYERVIAVLPKIFASQVRKWDAYYQTELQKAKRARKKKGK